MSVKEANSYSWQPVLLTGRGLTPNATQINRTRAQTGLKPRPVNKTCHQLYI